MVRESDSVTLLTMSALSLSRIDIIFFITVLVAVLCYVLEVKGFFVEI